MGNDHGKEKRPSSSYSLDRSPHGSPKGDRKHKHKKGDKKHADPVATSPAVKGPCDVMISHSQEDSNSLRMLRRALEKEGVSSWTQDVATGVAGVDFFTKIGQAIIDAKVIIPLLSEQFVKNKFCQDELALAYVSDKIIIPVSLAQPEELFPVMDMGMKLQLARFDWLPFEKDSLPVLVGKIKAALTPSSSSHTASPVTARKGNKRLRSAHQSRFQRQNSQLAGGDGSKMLPQDFWDRHFQGKQEVAWASFSQHFHTDFSRPMARLGMEEEEAWIMDVLKREMAEDETHVTRESFGEFCTSEKEGERPVWERVEDFITEAYTIREVFNVNSSVRVEAIENLSKFKSAAVVEALLDLLSDRDDNVRTVAAISLARTGSDSQVVIRKLLKCLKDKDRLVREAGCLALGHLKAKQAIPSLANLWRNDTISHVREAAAVALEQIGGEEAQKAMHVTRVLQDEIRRLNDMA